ncbi:MAG: hypothetical protein WCG48_00185 [Candidatus Berkelbacteria bacterium]
MSGEIHDSSGGMAEEEKSRTVGRDSERLSDETIELFRDIEAMLSYYKVSENQQFFDQMNQAITERDRDNYILQLQSLAGTDISSDAYIPFNRETLHRHMLEVIDRLRLLPEFPWGVMQIYKILDESEEATSKSHGPLFAKKINEDVDYDTQNLFFNHVMKKIRSNTALTSADIKFIYHDALSDFVFDERLFPVIDVVRQQRKKHLKVDAAITMECRIDEVAMSGSEINDRTKVYIGPLFLGGMPLVPDILKKLSNVPDVFLDFPKKMLRRGSMFIGGKDQKMLENEIRANDGDILPEAEDLMDSHEFIVSQREKTVKVIRLSVASLGFTGGASTIDIYERAISLGLSLCPAEMGPYLRINDPGNGSGNHYYVAMEPILNIDQEPSIFSIKNNSDGQKSLGATWAEDDHLWGTQAEFVFVQPDYD